MRMLDISPYCWEKMVLTMGSTLHFIQTLTFKHNGKVLSQCQMGYGISKNPFFSFKIKSAKAGDKVSISWQDNLAYSDTQEHIIS